MSISIIYHVRVDVPQDVWQEFAHTDEYDRMSCGATHGNVGAGCHSYSGAYEWAEFGTIEEARRCEERLQAMVAHFQSKMQPEYKLQYSFLQEDDGEPS